MSSCELCGRSMKGHGRYVTIEGAELLVCIECATKFGSQSTGAERRPSKPRVTPAWTSSPPQKNPVTRRPSAPLKKAPKSPPRSQTTLDDMILVEDYAIIIRNARQKTGLSQEELAQKIGERISTLQAIEAGRLKPEKKTIRGLERELGISLLEPIGSIPIKPSSSTRSIHATLGDRVVIKRKKSQKGEGT
jgi:putative transcription factor